MNLRRCFVTLLVAFSGAIACGSAAAQAKAFAMSDTQLARLGVRLDAVQPVDLVVIASGPAQVVVPPEHQALVSAPVSGVIARLLVAEGDNVAAGQPVAEIDSVELADRQRDYLDAVAGDALAAAQEARDRGLFDEGIIAERRLAESTTVARGARAKLDQSRAQLKLAGFSDADLARLSSSRELATRIVLRAPFAGVIAARHAEVGARVGALDAVYGVADLAELWLELRLPQEEAARVTPGMTASADVSGGKITGSVTTVGRVVDPASQMVLVRAAVDNASAALRAGQFVAARILARPEGGMAYSLPAGAVTRNGGEAFVFVRNGGQIEVRRVDVLADDGERVYVASGIATGTRVAVEGISALKALWLAEGEEGA
jgi:cobalt-zinc-cadmium efflux system membrane fusion protein